MQAVRANPWTIDGPGRPDTIVIERLGVFAKGGAEGVMVMVAPDGTTVALKMLDGSGRAATAVALRLLERAGALCRIGRRRCDDTASAVGHRRRTGCRGDPPRVLEALPQGARALQRRSGKDRTMRISVPTEVKNNEYRVALTPAGVHDLVAAGHEVFVQRGAGLGSSMPDAEYEAAGATLLDDPAEVWARAELLLKVKEPIASEYGYFRDDLVLFTYLHLAADRPLTDRLVADRVTAIAYETVQLAGRRPAAARADVARSPAASPRPSAPRR